MKSKLFVGTLLAAAVLTAGAAEAQAPDVITANLKSDQFKVFNVTFTDSGIVSLNAMFRQSNVDGDIIIVDRSLTTRAGRDLDDIDDEDILAQFISTVEGYEEGTLSGVAGGIYDIYVSHISGSNTKMNFVAYSKTGAGLEQGAARRAGYQITEGGTYAIDGPVPADMAAAQSIVQKARARKR